MRFMSFVRGAENQGMPPQSLMDAMGKLIEDSLKAGTLIETGGLAATSEAIRVRVENGSINVVDGPYSEAKEMIGGYAIMEYASKQDAIEGARQFLALHAEHWPEWKGECEIREMVFSTNG
jgi:hypothetical protein